MKKVSIFTDKSMPIDKVNDDIFSSFVEHLGRCIYEGIYEPGHPSADEDGFRRDVMELVKELNFSMIRYPGGNFLSGYNWKNGIGPKENRPVKLDLAWKTTETNQFGTDEFMKWCKKTNVKPMMAVNMGTGTPMEAAELVEYCNHSGGTTLTEQRKKNGSEQPYGVTMWCVGNEMDAESQIGHLNAYEYALKAKESAKLMRYVDDSLKLVICGSCTTDNPGYPEWDRVVLENTYESFDYLSLHQYFWADNNDNDFFASSARMDDYIKTMVGVCDFVKTKLRSNKEMMLSFDEWNIWNIPQSGDAAWNTAPHILEDSYTLKDAIVFASLMNTLINHCDRVKCACLAQVVNVIAPIMTKKGGEAIKQTTFYPFKLFSQNARGTAYLPIVGCDCLESEKYGRFKSADVSIVHNEGADEVTVFCCNFNDCAASTNIELRSFGNLELIEWTEMSGDLMKRNTFEEPDAVTPRKKTGYRKNGNIFNLELGKYSFNVIKFKIK